MIELGIGKMRPETRMSPITYIGPSPCPPCEETPTPSGSYTNAVIAAIENSAAGSVSSYRSLASTEAAAGHLSRCFAAGEVSGPPWAQRAVSPQFLGDVGRRLIRDGASMHYVYVTPDGRVDFLPCSSWDLRGQAHPSTWTVGITLPGPSATETRVVPYSGVIHMVYGTDAAQPYRGVSPLGFAAETARLGAELTRSLKEEMSGPVAQILPVPADGGADDQEEAADPLRQLRADIKGAKGRAIMLETVAAGWGEGGSAAPRKDWVASRLAPEPPASMEALAECVFSEQLLAMGLPASFAATSDGTAMRESLRRYFSITVEPLAGVLARELTDKLEVPISISFKGRFAADLSGRARAFQSLTAAGLPVDRAATLAGLLEPEE